jgi:DMSO/TMAO reductase YedYZ molybdopterin-dependent catalytic subunit
MKTARSYLSGVAAGCAFVLMALLGRVAARVPTLPELVQDRLVLLLPGQVFSFLLDRFLELGKPLLFTSLLLTQIALGGLVGVVIGRWGRPVIVAAVLWLATGLIVLPLAGRGVFAGSLAVACVTLFAFAAYVLAFMYFAGVPLPWRRQAVERLSQPVAARGQDRRRLIAGGLLGLGTAALAVRAIGRAPALPSRSGRRGSGQAGPDTPIPGLPPMVTPTDRFYVVSKNLIDPEIDAGRWRLQIDGLVERPLTLRYGDLLAMPAVTEYRTLECISNEVGGDLISNGLWTGVRLADLLAHAGVRPGAAAVFFTSEDRYTSSMPLRQAQDPTTLLAYRLNDGPLPQKHGYPLRVLGAGTYGMKNPKWLTHIEVTDATRAGFWQQQGWDEDEIVQTMSQIGVPGDGMEVRATAATIAGIAFAGARGVTRVEVSTDGGATWGDAQLLPTLGPNTWTFWRRDWQDVRPGDYVLTVRATDGAGTVQTARRTDPFPVGATGHHQVRVRVTA